MNTDTPRARAGRGQAQEWLDAHLARVEAMDRSQCIHWPFSTNGGRGGRYPQLRIDGTTVGVTRHIVERRLGRRLERGELIRHTCDQPRCVNPWHLQTGSHADNMADMTTRGRQAAGQRNGRSRLTVEDVRAIRMMDDEFYLTDAAVGGWHANTASHGKP